MRELPVGSGGGGGGGGGRSSAGGIAVVEATDLMLEVTPAKTQIGNVSVEAVFSGWSKHAERKMVPFNGQGKIMHTYVLCFPMCRVVRHRIQCHSPLHRSC